MPGYRLSHAALRDFSAIVTYLHKRVSPDVCAETEDEIWAACHALAHTSALGHRRSDLTTRPVLFHLVQRYFLVFQRNEDGVLIHAVLHASRDVAAILRRRKLDV